MKWGLPKREYDRIKLFFAALWPERVFLYYLAAGITVRIRKGHAEHWETWLYDRTWEERRVYLAERHFAKVLQQAQDSRFRHPKSKIKTFAQLQAEYDAKIAIAETRATWREERELRRKQEWAETQARQAADRDWKRRRSEAYAEKAAWYKEWEIRHKDVLGSRECHRKKEVARQAKYSAAEKGVAGLVRRIKKEPTKCYWCSTALPHGGHVDHVVPLSKGGTHSLHNLVPSCPDCNQTKRDIMPNSAAFPVSNQLQMALVA